MPSPKYLALVALALVLIGATAILLSQPSAIKTAGTTTPSPTSSAQTSSVATTSWKIAQLTDVLSGRSFSLSDFQGKPILVELMAVWCPLCTQQQLQLQQVGNQLGNKINIVSVDIDPSETSQALAKYANSNGFSWIWTKDSSGLFNSFFQLSPPETPVIVISPDGSYKVFSGKITAASDFISYLQGLGVKV